MYFSEIQSISVNSYLFQARKEVSMALFYITPLFYITQGLETAYF